MKIILILALFLFSVNSMATTYKIMPPMDKSLKTWIMGGAPYYGDCLSGLTETTVETLNQSQSKYFYDSDGWCSLTGVSFYNSGLEVLPEEFKALPNIKTFDLRNNLFTDIDFLSSHKDFTDVYIKSNPDLFNINGIRNATSGNFYFENYKEYDLLNSTSPFCQNIESGNINIIDSYAYNICEGFAGADPWLDFIKDCSGNAFNTIQDFKDSTASLSCSSKDIYNLPDLNSDITYLKSNFALSNNNLKDLSSFGSLTQAYILNLSNNNIDSLSGLSNLNSVSALYIHKNPISDLAALSNLVTVSSILDVSETSISDFSGLNSLLNPNNIVVRDSSTIKSFKGLENVGALSSINLRGSKNLNDVSHLSGIDIGSIYLDNDQLEQFEVKASAESRLCLDLKSNSARIYVYSSSGSGFRDSADLAFCEETVEESAYNAGAWLNFFNDPGNCSISNGPMDSLNDLKTRTASTNCNSKGLVDSDLPQGGLMTNNLNINLQSNNLETLSSFVDMTETGSLYLNNNNIASLTNLSNLNKVNGVLYLYNNPITSLSGLGNLTSVSSTFHLTGTEISDFTGLTSLNSVVSLHIPNTPSLTSFDGLENVTSIGSISLYGSTNIKDVGALATVDLGRINMHENQMDQFTVKAPADSSFCSDLRNDATRIYMYSSSGNGYRDGADLAFCEETLAESEYNAGAWLNFFNDTANCSISNGPLDSLNDLKTRTATTNCNSKALVDSNLPQGGLMASNLNLNFSHNNLDALSSFADITETGNLYLQNNNITSLANLSNLKTVKGNLYLASNPITSLSGLGNLTSVSSVLYLQSTNIIDFTGLTSLATAGQIYIYNNTSVESFNGLENVTSIGTINLRGTTNLTDVSDLASVDVGMIYMNESQMDQFTVKAPANSRFCNDLRSNATRIYMYGSTNGYRDGADLSFCEETLEEATYNTSAWLDFFNDTANCSISNGPLDSLNDLKTRTATPSCNSKNLMDSDLPQGGLMTSNLNLYFHYNNLETLSSFVDVTETGHLYLYGNNISSLANLSNLEIVKGHMNLSNNPITALSGLSNLTSISSTFNLAGTNIADFTGLTSLATIGSLGIYNNTSVESFKGLENVTSIGTINLRGATNLTDVSDLASVDVGIIYMNESQMDQFSVKALSNSRFCNDLRSDATRIYMYSSSGNGYRNGADLVFCEENLEESNYNAGAWIDFFNNTATCSITNGPLDSLSDLKTRTATTNCNSKNLVDSDLPQGGLVASNLHLNFNSNNLETLSAFVDVTETGHFYAQANNITSLANLSNLKTVKGHLYLQSNPITSLFGLSNLTSISSTFNLAATNITDFTGVTSLATVGSLNIYNNTSVESFNGLENVTSIGTINLRGATSLTNISGLANIDINIIYINENQLDQFNVKAPTNSRLCNDLATNAARLHVYASSGNGYRDDLDYKICD